MVYVFSGEGHYEMISLNKEGNKRYILNEGKELSWTFSVRQGINNRRKV